MTISKSQLISFVALDISVTQVCAGKALDSAIRIIEESLQEGEDVRIAGFGTFSLKKVPARTGRNPRTGAALAIPAKAKVVFKPAADFTAHFN